MWPVGTVLHNPVTAEWARLVQAEDSHTTAELIAMPTAHPAGPHRHPHLEERFEVLEGTLDYVLDGGHGTAGAGERVTVEPGVAHDWWNGSDVPCRARVTVTPPGNFADMIAAVWGIAVLGRANDYGAPKALDGILLARAFSEDIVLLSPPPAVQKVVAAVLGPLIAATGRSVTSREVLDAAVVDPGRWPGVQLTSSSSTP